MNKFVAGLVGAGLSLMSSVVVSEELKMLGSFPESFVWTKEIAKPFMEFVEEESGGELSLNFTGPDAVPGFEQLEPVQAGVFDVLFTHPAYHVGTTPIGMALDAVAADRVKRRESGVIEFIDQHYTKLGMKLIAAPLVGSRGFRFYLKDAVSEQPGLDGLKVRGSASYGPMIKELGGSPVIMGAGDVYSALQKGVVDGAAWPLTGALDFKWYEVAGYMSAPDFGQVGLMIFMNLDSWNMLSDTNKSAIERAALKLENYSVKRFDELAVAERASLIKRGVKVTSFSEKDADRLDQLWSQGVWDVAKNGSPVESEKMRELARNAGISD
jgi:TRAP-type C4-dicarboxylate transport system substrate-binding protein